MHELLNLPPQASSVARGIDLLHAVIIVTTFAGTAVVFAITAYFVVRYRRRPEAGPTPRTPRVVAPMKLEVAVIGVLATLFVGWWVIGFLQYRHLETPPASSMKVYVTAKQWMWKFAYPSGQTSTDVLVVPTHQPVELIMTSRDVLHGFYVPAFRIKQDVIPGRQVATWFEAVEPGTYDILCTQYCGTRHSFMRGQVVALEPADYAKWLDATPPSPAGGGTGLAARGEKVAADKGCLRCHPVDDRALPSIGPAWRHAFGATRTLATGAQVRVDEEYLTESMMDPGAKVASGFAPVMPSYRGALEPDEVAAIVEYIRSLR